jgi:hypothetical protein
MARWLLSNQIFGVQLGAYQISGKIGLWTSDVALSLCLPLPHWKSTKEDCDHK